MRIACSIIALCSYCLFFLALPVQAQPASPHHVSVLEGLVVGVAEGDRITVNSFGTEIPVRLYGVAAPQIAKVDKFTGWYKPGQPYAEDAFRALSIKVLHQQVKVEIRTTLLSKSESAQIAFAVVYLDGRNINLEMLNEGWAWADRMILSRNDHPRYLTTERIARSKKRGLWAQENPQPPWNFKPQIKIRAKQN
ncbi:nuclease [Citrifermentans bremense]|uniref:Nuclease n=1 Tax=Citrifermentans bremense TaxID=60035 RepID=A0A6S6LZR7_9BACT|nr:thermonuclease family protein [Citrifermentans bremense]BCG47053.1 nuclease [Citrifermentans bremense]